MAETRCERCKGTGYANAARDSGMEDMPMLLQPMGVFRCPNCDGKGRVGISDEAMDLLRKAIDRMHGKPSNGEVRGASRLAGEASSAEGATSTVVLCTTCHGEGGWEAAASSTNYFWKECADCGGTGKAKS